MPRARVEYLGNIRMTPMPVRWTAEEWDNLAERVWKKRAKHPDYSLPMLVNKVQQQSDWDQGRKRKIISLAQMKPLLDRLTSIDLRFVEMRDRDIQSLKDQIETFRSRPDKEEILAALSEEEIVRRFTEPVFKSLSPADIVHHFSPDELLNSIPAPEVFAHVGKAIFGEMSLLQDRLTKHLSEAPIQESKPESTSRKHAVGKPKIAFVGIQQHQLRDLQSHLGNRCEVIFVPKSNDRSACATIIADRVVLWESYTTGVQRQEIKRLFHGDRLTLHRGTLSELIDRVEKSLPSKPR